MTELLVSKVRDSEIAMRPLLPLAQPLDLGHVGTVSKDGVYSHLGSIQTMLGLNNLGGELPPQDKALNLSVTSGKSVKVGFRASADTDGTLAQFGNLKGKASISFGSENGFFIAVKSMTIRQLAQPQLLNMAILNAYERGHWKKNWVFIHQLGIAKKLTVVLASEKNTTVLIQGSGKVALGATLDIDVAAGFKFVASTKAVTQITGGRNITAFYNAYRVHDGIFSEPEIKRFRGLQVPFGIELAQYPREFKAEAKRPAKMLRPV